MLDDKDTFESPFGLELIGRIVIGKIATAAKCAAEYQGSSHERFFEECRWIKAKIKNWHQHIDIELRHEGLLPEGRQQ